MKFEFAGIAELLPLEFAIEPNEFGVPGGHGIADVVEDFLELLEIGAGGGGDLVSEDGGIAQGFDGEGGAGELGFPVDDLRIEIGHLMHEFAGWVARF